MKKLKLLCLMLTATCEIYAQTSAFPFLNQPVPSAPVNYYQMREAEEQYYQQHPGTNHREGDDLSQYNLWKHFWDDRINANTGSMDEATEAMMKYMDNPHDYCTPSVYPSKWKCIGPNDNKNNKGLVTKIWVDPANEDHLIIATNGGVWETSFDTDTWHCISDQPNGGLPVTGIGSMVVNASGASPEIWVGTQAREGEGYPIGLMHRDPSSGVWNADQDFLALYTSLTSKTIAPSINDVQMNDDGDLYVSFDKYVFKRSHVAPYTWESKYEADANDPQKKMPGMMGLVPGHAGQMFLILRSNQAAEVEWTDDDWQNHSPIGSTLIRDPNGHAAQGNSAADFAKWNNFGPGIGANAWHWDNATSKEAIKPDYDISTNNDFGFQELQTSLGATFPQNDDWSLKATVTLPDQTGLKLRFTNPYEVNPGEDVLNSGAVAYEIPLWIDSYHNSTRSKSGKIQYIFTATELSQPSGLVKGNINAITFFADAINNVDDLTINMWSTTLSSFSNATFDNPVSSQNVYYGQNLALNGIDGINTLNFDKAFQWDGTSNIVIEVIWHANQLSWTNSYPYQKFNTTTSPMACFAYSQTPNYSFGTTGDAISNNRWHLTFSGRRNDDLTVDLDANNSGGSVSHSITKPLNHSGGPYSYSLVSIEAYKTTSSPILSDVMISDLSFSPNFARNYTVNIPVPCTGCSRYAYFIEMEPSNNSLTKNVDFHLTRLNLQTFSAAYILTNHTNGANAILTGTDIMTPLVDVHTLNTANPTAPIIYLTNSQGTIEKSVDGGITFDAMYVQGGFNPNEPHVDIRSSLVLPNGHVFIGTDGGIVKSINQCSTYIPMNKIGLSIGQSEGFDESEQTDGGYVVANIHEGTWYHDNINGWNDPSWAGGDVYSAAHSKTSGDEAIIIGGGDYNADLKRSSDLGNQPNATTYNINSYTRELEYHPITDDLLIGTSEIYNVPRTGAALTKIYNTTDNIQDVTHGLIRSMYIGDEVQNGIMYAVTAGIDWGTHTTTYSSLVKFDPVSNGWSNLASMFANPLPTDVFLSCVTADPDNPSDLWVGCAGMHAEDIESGTPTNRVFHYNPSTNKLEDVSSGLPLFPVTKLAFLRGSQDIVFAGTDVGVYVWNKNANGGTGQWECFNTDLPSAAMVTDMHIAYCERKLRITTNSRSIWETDLPISASPFSENWGDAYGSSTIINGGRITPNGVDPDFASQYSGNYNSPKVTNNINHDIELFGDGVNVTLSYATLRFTKGYGLKVGTGVKLTLDHCVLESSCGCFWNGINVKGSTCETQDLYSNGSPVSQGFLSLSNTTVREALVGVSVYDQTAYDWGGGGIVQATNSIFEDNQQAVGFMKYPHDPGDWGANQCSNFNAPQTNKSFFSNCTFRNTKVLNDHMRFQRFISMWGVNQVHFTMCKFENQTGFTDQFTQGNSFAPDQLGTGIYTEDANFIVDGLPATGPVPARHSSFSNLNYGVLAGLGSALKPLIVKSTDFTNTKQGLALSGVNLSTVQYNTFNQLGTYPTKSSALSAGGVVYTTNTGLSVIGSKLVSVLDNCFSSTLSASNPTYNTTFGAWYYNNGPQNWIVNSNHFSQIPTAQYAQGKNTNIDGSAGLGFRSNWHDNSGLYDLAVWDGRAFNPGTYQLPVLSPSWGTVLASGICATQGGEQSGPNRLSASNQFSDAVQAPGIPPNRGINWNVSSQPTVTYFTRYAQLPIGSTGNYVYEYPANTTLNVRKYTGSAYIQSPLPIYYCAGEPSIGGIIHQHTTWTNITDYQHIKIPFEPGVRPQIINIFGAAHALHTSSMNTLKAYIDGGSSDNELKMITDAGSGDMSTVFSTLLSHSPYLSERTGIAIANATTLFPPEYRYALLAANPDILRDNKILNIVINQDPPMDDSLINNLIDISDSVTDRTLLQADITGYSIDMHMAVQFLITDITLDSTGIDHSAICGWLDSLQEPEADMMIVDDLMGRGLYDSAQARIDSMPGKYDLDSSQLAAIASYTDLITYFSTASSSGVRFDSLLWHYADSGIIDPINAYDPPYPSSDGSATSASGGSTGSGNTGSSTTCGLTLAEPFFHQCRTDSAISVDHTVHDLYFNLRYTGRFQSPVTFSVPGKKIVKQTVSRLGAYTPVHLEILDSPSLAWSYRVIATAYDSSGGPCSIPIPVDSAGMNISMLDSCGFTYTFLIDSILSDDGHEHVTSHFVATVYNPLDKAVDLVIMPQVGSQMQAINYTKVHVRAEDSLTLGGSFWQKDTLPGTIHFIVAAIDSSSDTLCMTDVYFDNAIHHNSGLWRSSGGITSAGGSGGSGGSHGGSGGDVDTTTHTPIFGSIQQIADQGSGPAALRARNFLKFFYHENYEDLPVLPVDRTLKTAKTQKPQKKDLSKSSRVRIYPNPGNDLVTLDYRIADNSDAATLSVVNSMGQLMFSTTVLGSTGTRQIDTRQFAGGLYLYRITSQKGYTAAGSFVISH